MEHVFFRTTPSVVVVQQRLEFIFSSIVSFFIMKNVRQGRSGYFYVNRVGANMQRVRIQPCQHSDIN